MNMQLNKSGRIANLESVYSELFFDSSTLKQFLHSLDKEEESELIELLMNSRDLFDSFIYTPWRDAADKTLRRRDDLEIQQHISAIHPSAPGQLFEKRNVVLARNVATPNYEVYRFRHFIDVLDKEFKPYILEFHNDKYVNINPLKHALAEISFYEGVQNEVPILDKKTIINRNESNGLKINELQTKRGDSFVGFHHEFFAHAFPDIEIEKLDMSEMYRALGGRASQYYEVFLTLFLRNSILFEDFTFSKEESPFTKNVVLPAFINVIKKTGKKPLVISIGPKGNETDLFWTSYPPHLKEFVENKLQKNDGGAV